MRVNIPLPWMVWVLIPTHHHQPWQLQPFGWGKTTCKKIWGAQWAGQWRELEPEPCWWRFGYILLEVTIDKCMKYKPLKYDFLSFISVKNQIDLLSATVQKSPFLVKLLGETPPDKSNSTLKDRNARPQKKERQAEDPTSATSCLGRWFPKLVGKIGLQI